MAGWSFFLAIIVSLQVVQDGVHSCTLRSHKAPGPQSACSTPGAADPSPAIPRRTPASCATPTHGLHYPDALNKIPSITSSLSNPVPAAALPPVPVPHYLAPVSASTSGNDRILIDLLLEYFAALEPPRRLPLPPLSSSPRGFTPASLPVLLTPTPYPVTPNPQIGQAELQQFLSLLLSVSGPGSVLPINPAVPSDRLLPSLSPAPPAHTTTPPPATVSANAIPEAATTEATATAPVDESSKPTSAPETVPASPPSSVPATDPADSVPANDAVGPSDPGSPNVPAVSAPINASDSTLVAPEASGSTLEAIPAPATNTVPAPDSVPASSSADVASSAPPPSDITTPSVV
ncbi:vegetative cell wall protein gp1-like [Myzus persicae]|uniref:vegetative cell wall protein gp1-like n=1 Tax=Myzus persicae TaxID=13164 RepID=UPI000B9368AC|nr:vegetative cell wall protein gp1-like [Myzus persicae]